MSITCLKIKISNKNLTYLDTYHIHVIIFKFDDWSTYYTIKAHNIRLSNQNMMVWHSLKFKAGG